MENQLELVRATLREAGWDAADVEKAPPEQSREFCRMTASFCSRQVEESTRIADIAQEMLAVLASIAPPAEAR